MEKERQAMRQASPRLALDHMAASRLDARSFFALGRDQGLTDVQIRDHLRTSAASRRPPSGLPPPSGRHDYVCALQRFDEWTPARK
jgi:2-keto-myo-inositol isomerase